MEWDCPGAIASAWRSVPLNLMSSPDVESEIDRLYQLPRDEFTAARNALARRLGGPEGVRIKSLSKPSLSAWAVNQLYWKEKDVIARILDARAKLERAQEAVLTGRQADVRKAMEQHRRAIQDGLEALRRHLTPAEWTADKQHAVRQVLEGLAADSRPGRLAAEQEPAGFDVFSGIAPQTLRPRPHQAQARERPTELPTRPGAPGREGPRPSATGSAGADRPARTAAREASRALSEARRKLRSAEREARRAQAVEEQARKRREEESSRERRAKELHDEAVRKLAGAQADLERSQQAAAAAAKALQDAEQELERISNPEKH